MSDFLIHSFRYKNVHAEVEQFGSVTAAAQKKLETFTESVKHINEVITMSSICSDVDLAGPTDTVSTILYYTKLRLFEKTNFS